VITDGIISEMAISSGGSSMVGNCNGIHRFSQRADSGDGYSCVDIACWKYLSHVSVLEEGLRLA
jgi:hypothetical protein